MPELEKCSKEFLKSYKSKMDLIIKDIKSNIQSPLKGIQKQ